MDKVRAKLIHVGFTDENHIERSKSKSGAGFGRFYPDSEGGQFIPIYMLERHVNRLGAEEYCYLHELEKKTKEQQAVIDELKAVLAKCKEIAGQHDEGVYDMDGRLGSIWLAADKALQETKDNG